MKKSKKAKKHEDVKNFSKIMGQKCITLILNGFFEKELWSLFRKEYEKLMEEKGNVGQKVTLEDFKQWAKGYKEQYIKLKVFREIWGDQGEGDFNETLFRRCLTKITKLFLEEYYYKLLIDNAGPKKIQKVSRIESFMDMIPKFLRGIDNPGNFTNLSE